MSSRDVRANQSIGERIVKLENESDRIRSLLNSLAGAAVNSAILGTDNIWTGVNTFQNETLFGPFTDLILTSTNFDWVQTSSSDGLFSSKQDGDTNQRFQLDADGTSHWGDGASAFDTKLYRDSAGVLKTDNSAIVGADLIVNGGSSLGSSPADTIGFYGTAPTAQQSSIPSPSGGGTIDSQSRAAINSLISALATIGIIAP